MPEDEPREPTGYEQETADNEEQTKREPQSSEDVYIRSQGLSPCCH